MARLSRAWTWAEVMVLLLTAVASITGLATAAANFDTFKTEPTFTATRLVVYVNKGQDAVQPGYLFITPFDGSKWQGYGPHIFAQDGVRLHLAVKALQICSVLTWEKTLVWYGNGTAHNRAMDFHVCDYEGQVGRHLCFHDSKPEFSAYARGTVRFLDDSYTPLSKEIGAAGGLSMPDLHELHTVDQGRSVLQTVYDVKPADLTPYRGPREGFVLDGCFQDVRVRDSAVAFQWCALDHVKVWETKVYITQSENYSTPIAGDGSLSQPWDFFHINSVDRTSQGDYLVSARHLNSLLKIAGPHSPSPGSILWRLGGHESSFTIHGFNFSRQHMARIVSATKDKLVISQLDNAFDGHLSSNSYSRGQLIALDEEAMTASLVQEYPSPEHWLSHSQGGMQVQPNDNALVSWGFHPAVSEFSRTGELLYHASFGVWGMDIESYRAYKAPWVGRPRSKPKLVAYSLQCRGPHPLFGYVSWNGATEVASWRFYVSRTTKHGPWRLVATVPKQGFETMTQLRDDYAPFVYVEALDASGKVLARSQTEETFVPDMHEMHGRCNQRECFSPDHFDYGSRHSMARSCSVAVAHHSVLAVAVWAGLALLGMFLASRLYRRHAASRRQHKYSLV